MSKGQQFENLTKIPGQVNEIVSFSNFVQKRRDIQGHFAKERANVLAASKDWMTTIRGKAGDRGHMAISMGKM